MRDQLASLRIAVRALIRARWSTVLQLATIAIGVGGVSAVLGVVSAVVLRPLPFEHPEQLVTLDVTSSKGYGISTSIPNLRDWRDRTHVFSSYGAVAGWSFRLTRNGETEILDGGAVYGDLFRVLGVKPALGRFFTAAETEPGTAPLAVLGYSTWQTKFAGDSTLVGKAIDIGSSPHTVVGVLPQDFSFPRTEPQMLVNMGSISGLPWDDRRSSFGTRVFARARAGLSLDAVRADVERTGREVRELNGPDTALPSVRSLGTYLLGERVRQLWFLMAAVAAVLAIALANAGGLVLARAVDRRRDAAVRLALGGRRADVLQGLLRENILLTLVGGAIGLVVAEGLMRLLLPMLPADLPRMLVERIAIDRWTVLVTLLVCLAAGLAFGVMAAAHAAPRELLASLRGGAQSVVGSRGRARGALVILETALSLVLAVASTLLLTSFLRLHGSDKGFNAEGVLTARTAPSAPDYDGRDKWLAYYDGLLDQARALPGVRVAAASLLIPLSDRSWELSIQPEEAAGPVSDGPSVLFNMVSEDYFGALGVPLVRGRAFARTDNNESLPVAIIDETMAQKFWPGVDPLGKRVTLGEHSADSTLLYRTVVGVAKNVRHYTLASPSRIQVYVPVHQTLARWGQALFIALRTAGSPASLVAPLRAAAAATDPRVPIWSIATTAEYVDRSIAGERALGVITVWLAAVASLVTAVGLFGIVSYAVIRRRRELALRMALGEAPGQIVARITRGGMVMAGIGVGIGLVVAAAVSRFVKGFLYGIGALDLRTYLVTALALLAVSAAASLVPALAARRVQPARVLREE
jgi:putative ABC transport system permease protein